MPKVQSWYGKRRSREQFEGMYKTGGDWYSAGVFATAEEAERAAREQSSIVTVDRLLYDPRPESG